MLKCLVSLRQEQTSEWGCAGVIGYSWKIQVVCPRVFKVVQLAPRSWVPLGREPLALPALFLLPPWSVSYKGWGCDIFWFSFICLFERQAPCVHSLVTMKSFKAQPEMPNQRIKGDVLSLTIKKKSFFFFLCVWICFKLHPLALLMLGKVLNVEFWDRDHVVAVEVQGFFWPVQGKLCMQLCVPDSHFAFQFTWRLHWKHEVI